MTCSKWSWRVWLPFVVCRPTARQWIEESNQMRRIKASWDCADFEVWGQRGVLERRCLVRRSSCDEIADNCRDSGAVSRGLQEREKKPRVDVIGVMRGNSLAESYV